MAFKLALLFGVLAFASVGSFVVSQYNYYPIEIDVH
jgi:hypothetical protein